MSKRSDEDWESDLEFFIYSMNGLQKYQNDKRQLKRHATKLRNPFLFDINSVEILNLLLYKIPNPNKLKETKDHLIGMSNIILFIYKKELYKKCINIEYFKKLQKALQVKIVCPRKLNNGPFKKWKFDYDNIEECIYWYKKLLNNNITKLLDKDGNEVDVMIVWQKWYDVNKEFLQ